jgi:hypothetical protein
MFIAKIEAPNTPFHGAQVSDPFVEIKSRYMLNTPLIAVATLREPESEGAKSLMIFDTQTDQVVGNRV